jgi:hypothetical protein
VHDTLSLNGHQKALLDKKAPPAPHASEPFDSSWSPSVHWIGTRSIRTGKVGVADNGWLPVELWRTTGRARDKPLQWPPAVSFVKEGRLICMCRLFRPLPNQIDGIAFA